MVGWQYSNYIFPSIWGCNFLGDLGKLVGSGVGFGLWIVLLVQLGFWRRSDLSLADRFGSLIAEPHSEYLGTATKQDNNILGHDEPARA
jgi:hypothetical protein